MEEFGCRWHSFYDHTCPVSRKRKSTASMAVKIFKNEKYLRFFLHHFPQIRKIVPRVTRNPATIMDNGGTNNGYFIHPEFSQLFGL